MVTKNGTSGNDVMEVNPSSEGYVAVYCLAGDDTVYIKGGPYSTPVRPYISGGDGLDTISFLYFNQAVYASLGGGISNNVPSPTSGQFVAFNSLPSQNSIENLTGTSYSDFLSGDGNDNRLEGRGGSDYLIGCRGKDTLVGGSGSDTFVFQGADSTGGPIIDSTTASPDVITDFVRGQDKVDLTNFSNMKLSGASNATYVSQFKWYGAMGSNAIPMGYAGYRVTSTGVDLYANPYGLNGNTTPEVRISLSGLTALSAADVLL
jgi:Ca2+-binding RTX toxin-like protein